MKILPERLLFWPGTFKGGDRIVQTGKIAQGAFSSFRTLRARGSIRKTSGNFLSGRFQLSQPAMRQGGLTN
jgi:hypothetical protein